MQKIKEKVTVIVEMEITEERLKEMVRKRKNWSAPGLMEYKITGGRNLLE